MARSSKTEAVVLRSFRFGEADRILHVYTAEHGRIGAIAKGVRKTKSRFGARLEPFSHVELLLHQGSGELRTVTGVSLVDAHRPAREDPYRLSVALIGAEAMGASRKRYAELEAVYSELEEAAKLHKRLRCPVIDVTELSVEETAMRIIRLVERRRRATAPA